MESCRGFSCTLSSMIRYGQEWTKEEIEQAIARNEPEELLYVPICVSMEPEDCAST